MDYEAKSSTYRKRVEAAIDHWIPQKDTRPTQLHEAMRYSIDSGGKRIRPILLLASFDLNPSHLDPDPAAAAIEVLHTYSLIHDDLPCMDNSDLRRGNPTCHKQFDEATALLAGDALLTEAFAILANAYNKQPSIAIDLIKDLGDAAGSCKLIGGQMEDLIREDDVSPSKRLEFIHQNKTAALITAAITMGMKISKATEDMQQEAKHLGHHLGLAFQIIDDILDVSADSKVLGKSTGLDEINGTLTYPKLYGIEASKSKATEHTKTAIDICKDLGAEDSYLMEIVKQLEFRIY